MKFILFSFLLFSGICTFSQSFSVSEMINMYNMSGVQFRNYVNDKGYIGTSKETKPFFLYYNNTDNQISNVVYFNEVTKENVHAIIWKLNDPFLRIEFKNKLISRGFKHIRLLKIDKYTTSLFYSNKEYLFCLTTKIDLDKIEPANYTILLQSANEETQKSILKTLQIKSQI